MVVLEKMVSKQSDGSWNEDRDGVPPKHILNMRTLHIIEEFEMSWFYSVVVITRDSDLSNSRNPGSNPGRTSFSFSPFPSYISEIYVPPLDGKRGPRDIGVIVDYWHHPPSEIRSKLEGENSLGRVVLYFHGCMENVTVRVLDHPWRSRCCVTMISWSDPHGASSARI